MLAYGFAEKEKKVVAQRTIETICQKKKETGLITKQLHYGKKKMF